MALGAAMAPPGAKEAVLGASLIYKGRSSQTTFENASPVKLNSHEPYQQVPQFAGLMQRIPHHINLIFRHHQR